MIKCIQLFLLTCNLWRGIEDARSSEREEQRATTSSLEAPVSVAMIILMMRFDRSVQGQGDMKF